MPEAAIGATGGGDGSHDSAIGATRDHGLDDLRIGGCQERHDHEEEGSYIAAEDRKSRSRGWSGLWLSITIMSFLSILRLRTPFCVAVAVGARGIPLVVLAVGALGMLLRT